MSVIASIPQEYGYAHESKQLPTTNRNRTDEPHSYVLITAASTFFVCHDPTPR